MPKNNSSKRTPSNADAKKVEFLNAARWGDNDTLERLIEEEGSEEGKKRLID